MNELDVLADAGRIQRVNVETDPVVWYPAGWGDLVSRERVVLFLKRHEVVVDSLIQYTRA